MPTACADRVAALCAEAGHGPVLELGIGSGRLALPLVERGVDVHGIDASAAMVDLLRAKPGGAGLPVTIGDMAELALVDPPLYAVVFVAFNTFFNLGTEAAQRRCLERVAALLAPDGWFLLEAFVPGSSTGAGIDGAVTPRRITADEVVLAASQRDRAAQTITGPARPHHRGRHPAAAVAPPLRHARPARRHGRGRGPGAGLASRRVERRALRRRQRRPRFRVPAR